MAQILGYTVDTMTGMRASSLVDEETHAGLSGHLKRRREGMSEHYETRLRTRDGAVVHVLVSASPFLDDDGHYVGALALVTDVTALREAEEIVRSQSRHIQPGVDEGALGEEPAP
jgi:PAS domain S-box-containing protein